MTRAEARTAGQSRYFTGRPCSKGHVAERYVRGGCVTCRSITRKKWGEDNQDRTAANSRRWSKASPRKALSRALYAALKRCPTVDPITPTELFDLWTAQGGKCALTGATMTWAGGGSKASPTSISIDRIHPLQGYTAGNLRLICHWVNMAKGEMSDGELLEVCHDFISFTTKKAQS